MESLDALHGIHAIFQSIDSGQLWAFHVVPVEIIAIVNDTVPHAESRREGGRQGRREGRKEEIMLIVVLCPHSSNNKCYSHSVSCRRNATVGELARRRNDV